MFLPPLDPVFGLQRGSCAGASCFSLFRSTTAETEIFIRACSAIEVRLEHKVCVQFGPFLGDLCSPREDEVASRFLGGGVGGKDSASLPRDGVQASGASPIMCRPGLIGAWVS